MTTVKTAVRGRPAALRTSKKIAEIVASIAADQQPSRYIALQLVEMGYVDVELVPHTGRGRPAHRYTVAGRGRSLLALAARWK